MCIQAMHHTCPEFTSHLELVWGAFTSVWCGELPECRTAKWILSPELWTFQRHSQGKVLRSAACCWAVLFARRTRFFSVRFLNADLAHECDPVYINSINKSTQDPARNRQRDPTKKAHSGLKRRQGSACPA